MGDGLTEEDIPFPVFYTDNATAREPLLDVRIEICRVAEVDSLYYFQQCKHCVELEIAFAIMLLDIQINCLQSRAFYQHP